ncbi:putative Protein F14D2.9 [Daphnia magna]|uniref:DDE Tnp4 domain-containing protein n=1 Tax=Daphnia magna TaxID=35525 RepID=A0A164MBT1_9CRUS|nr:putative Protein F14D2.9 [Daphnia magna]
MRRTSVHKAQLALNFTTVQMKVLKCNQQMKHVVLQAHLRQHHILSLQNQQKAPMYQERGKENPGLGCISMKLAMRITKAKRRITPFDHVLIDFQFYGTETFQTVVGNVLKYSQATVCCSIHDVSRALCMIAHDHIHFPPNLLQLKREFSEIARIPGIIGCIDTHIRIQRPHQHEYALVNRKGYHSINVQGVCDANGHLLSVNATKPGSVHDSTMFKMSGLGLQYVLGEFGEGFLLGDSGYGCTPYLITPFNIPSNDEEV